MLGWEFPPIYSGGLGVACDGISRALAPIVDLTLILPRNEQKVDIKGAHIISIGDLELQNIFSESEMARFEKIITEKKIQFSLNPYDNPTVKKESEGHIEVAEKGKKHIEQLHNHFREAENYGSDVIQNVRYYSEIVQIIAQKLKFDIIHAHDWMTFQAGIMLKEKYGKPLILHVHSLNYDRLGPGQKGFIYQLEKEALTKADLIIPVSRYTGDIIKEHYGVKSKKIVHIHNGIEPVTPFKTERKFPEKVVLFLGRVTLQKGPEYFIDTASKVIKKFPAVRFVVAGEGDQLKKMIEAGASRFIGHKIHFTGFIDRQKVHTLLSMTDILCMPSVSEPFGLTALEAVQFGIPVVLSGNSGAAEVLKGALKANYWDTDSMAAHIVNLLTDQSLYEKCADQGRRDLKRLTWTINAEKIREQYHKLLA